MITVGRRVLGPSLPIDLVTPASIDGGKFSLWIDRPQQAGVVYDLWNLETSSFLAYRFRGAAARARRGRARTQGSLRRRGRSSRSLNYFLAVRAGVER